MAQRGRGHIFRPTDEQRDNVEIYVCGGMTHEEIAVVLGITKPTLEKHFQDELAHGRARKRAEIMQMLVTSGRKGNVSAQKYLHAVAGVQAAAAEWEAAEAAGKPPPARKLGKKEEQAVAAATAGQGTEWGDDLVPSGTTH
jgi:predicted transcriptional regulator